MLSGEEHRQLREIDEQLTRQDPQLAQRLSGCVAHRAPGRQRVVEWRRLLLAWAVLCGVALIVGGALTHHAVLSLSGMYLVLAAASRALSVLRP